MCNKKKMGFTLIELLAVIIILGILLAIAVPAISKYINSSRKNVYIDSMAAYLEAVKNGIYSGDYPSPTNTNDAIVISFGAIIDNIDHGGEKSPFGGSFINDNPNLEYCYVVVVNVGTKSSPKYKYYISALDSAGYGLAYPDNLNNTIILADDLSDDKVVQLTSGTSMDSNINDFNVISRVTDSGSTLYPEFTIGTPVIDVNGSKWHVFKDSSNTESTVTLLSDYNITSSGNFNTSCTGGIDSRSENSSSYTCSPVVYYNYDGSSNANTILDNFSTNIRSALPGTTNVTIPTTQEIFSITGTPLPSYGNYYINSSIYNWLLSTNYWTLSDSGYYTSPIYAVNGYYRCITNSYNHYGSSTYGIRPVITTLKSNLVGQ